MSEALETMKKFSQQLARMEADSAIVMAKRWKLIEDRLWKYFDALLDEIGTNGIKSDSQIYSLYRYQELIRVAQEEISQYEVWAAGYISNTQKRAIEFGFDAAVRSVYGNDFFAPMVNTLAVSNMVGLCADGKPLFALMSNRKLDAASVEGLTQKLIEGVALGYNPKKTARLMAAGLAKGLDKALVIARTEQNRVYREATREQYRNMGIKQYQRHCAKSDRTCLACLGLDGKIYPTNTEFASHPNCRCFLTSIIPGEESDHASAQVWFKGLNEERQREILGKGHFELYKQGVPLSDMVVVKNDPTWGPTIGIRSLNDIDFAWAQAYKTQLGKEAYGRLDKSSLLRVELQKVRIAEIEKMGDAGINMILNQFEKAIDLPKLAYHFNKHGIRFGFNTEQEYLESYQQFVQRKDLRIFTFIRDNDRMWYKVDLDMGIIAQYNENKEKAWSYFYQENIRRSFFKRPEIVEVISTGTTWEIKKWNSPK